MVIIDNIPHLSVKNLLEFGFSQSFLDKQTSVGNYPCIYAHDPEQPTRKEVKLIPITGIPEATRIEKNIPSAEALAEQHRKNQLLHFTGLDHEAYQFYLNHPDIKPTKTHTREHVAKGKAEQVHFLKAIASLKTKEVTLRGFANKDEFYLACIDSLNSLAASRSWHAWKCTTLEGFRKRLKPFLQTLKGKASNQQCWSSLITKKAGNANAQKLETDQQALLVQLYADANAKPNCEQVWSIYTRKAQEMVAAGFWTEKALVNESTVRQYLYKPGTRQLWFEARHGYQEYRNVFEPVTQRQRPSYANALWVIDGTPSHRYFNAGDNKGRYFRFNIFPVLDAHSWCVVGFWLSEAENTEAVLGALRSACMVSGHMPYQVLYDNSSAIQSYRAQEAINKIAVTAFAAQAGNARAKIVENFFHLFNQDVQKFRPGFTHNPFAVSLNNRPNREALAAMVKSHELPAAEQALKQAIEDLTIWNNQPRKFLGGKSPLETYRASVAATQHKQRVFTPALDMECFWHLPGEAKKVRTMEDGKPRLVNTYVPQTYEITNRGIEIVIKGRKCFYNIDELRLPAPAAWRTQYIGARVAVKYEPNPERWSNGQQPDTLMLYLNGAPLLWQGQHVAMPVNEQFAMAVADYREGEGKRLHEHRALKKEQRNISRSQFAEIIEHTKRNGTYTEVITENAFDKQVLQDTHEQILNDVLNGPKWLDGPQDDTEEVDNEQVTVDKKKADRLSGYDEQTVLE
jgi:hypothetical protein